MVMKTLYTAISSFRSTVERFEALLSSLDSSFKHRHIAYEVSFESKTYRFNGLNNRFTPFCVVVVCFFAHREKISAGDYGRT